MSESADKMAIGGATLIGLAALARGAGGSPGPGPGPGPTHPGRDPAREQFRDSSGAVTTTGRILFGPNFTRIMVAIVNDGDATVYICFSDTPVVNTGIRLNSNGGSMIIDAESIRYGTISAIALAGDSAVTAVELYETPYSYI